MVDIARKLEIEREVNALIAKARSNIGISALTRDDTDRDEQEIRKTERDIAAMVEPRRAPNGRLMLVPRGTPPDDRILEAQSFLSIPDILEWKRPAKRRRYLKKIADPAYKGPRIVGEGDSWLEYPCNKDNGEWIGDDYALLSLARAGDTWADVINDENETYADGTPKGLFKTVAIEHPEIVILSVSGNDVVGNLAQFLTNFRDGKPPQDYVTSDFDLTLNYVEYNFRQYTQRLIAAGCHVIIHTYDYPDPRPSRDGGQWLGGPMQNSRHIPGPTLWRDIINYMLGLYRDRLRRVAALPESQGNVHLIELFGTIGTADTYAGPNRALWTDEMHGNADGFKLIAQQFKNVIATIPRRVA
ncbi:MAG: hypothetical protein GC182_23150 [Rhodopseudomonas sp.]|nr:hypothetical protein [Rhodopseudomonas sp.]